MEKQKPKIIEKLEKELGVPEIKGYTYHWQRNNKLLKAFSNRENTLDLTIRRKGSKSDANINEVILDCTVYDPFENFRDVISLLYKFGLVEPKSESQ